MKISKRNLYNSPILNSWFNGSVQLLSSIIVIPIVLTKLNIEEINVWFLLTSISAFGHSLVYGFSSTFSRFFTYVLAGVDIKDFSQISSTNNKVKTEINWQDINTLFIHLKVIFLGLSFFFLVVVGFIGYYFMKGPILALSSGSDGWLIFFTVLFFSSINLYLNSNNVFLQGMKKVHITQKVMGLCNLFGLIPILFVLYFYPSLVNIVIVYQLVFFSSSFSVYLIGQRFYKNCKVNKKKPKLDKKVISIVWDSAWKNGFTSIVSGVMKHLSSLLIAQWFLPSVSASFLLTKKLFDVLEKFTVLSFTARLPNISFLKAQKNSGNLNLILKQTIRLCFGVFIIGYILMIVFGEGILLLFNSNISMGGPFLLVLFSFSTFLSRWSGIMLSVSNQSNKIIEHKNALIVFFFFFSGLMLTHNFLGLLAFPLSQIISLLVAFPLIIKNVYEPLGTNFSKFEKTLLFPGLTILAIINLIYFLK
jgi:O-antigen/teichoic acid export membrane protein